MGLGGSPLLLTNICKDGEKHCFPNPLVGDGAGETGVKSILLGEYNFSGLSKSLSLCKHKVVLPHNSQFSTSQLFFTTQTHLHF